MIPHSERDRIKQHIHPGLTALERKIRINHTSARLGVPAEEVRQCLAQHTEQPQHT
jgi:hypothetical protein